MRLRIRSKLILSYGLVALIPMVGILVMPMVNEPLLRESTSNRVKEAMADFYAFIDHQGGRCQSTAEEIVADATFTQAVQQFLFNEAASYAGNHYVTSDFYCSVYQPWREKEFEAVAPYVSGSGHVEIVLPPQGGSPYTYYAAQGKAALRDNDRFLAGVVVYYPLARSAPSGPDGTVKMEMNPEADVALRAYSPRWKDLVYTRIVSPSSASDYNTVAANDPAAATRIYVDHKPAMFYVSPRPATGESSSETQQSWLQAYMPLMTAENQFVAIFATGQPLIPLRVFYQYTALYMLVFSAIGALVALIAGAWFARSISRRIWLLARGARRISEGSLDFEIVDAVPDELGDLAHIFNIMTRRLQSNLTELRQRADVIEEKNRLLDQTVAELTHVRDFTENVLRQVGSGVFTVDAAGRITQINPACRQLFAPDATAKELLGARFGRLLPPGPLRSRIADLLAAPVSITHWETTETVHGKKLPVEVSIAPMESDAPPEGMVVTVRDLSLIRGLEESVRRSEKLAALGHLSAGMAHEIRNPLGIIKGSAELLERKFAGSEDARDLARYIIDESVRLSRTLQDFLDFARPREPALDRASINQVIRRTVPLADHHPLRDRVRLVVQLDEHLPDLLIDAAQCQQVVLNLLLNAFEASHEGGTVAVRSRLEAATDTAVVTVEDEGAGISREQMASIFNPFFTTKTNGTGLGLSIVHRIMESHHASVEVASRDGEGTVFTLRFPVHCVPAEAPGEGE